MSSVTSNEMTLRMTAGEREALNVFKTACGLTVTQAGFAIMEGKFKPLKPLPSGRKGAPQAWNIVKFYPTDEQADFLVAEAEHRKTTIAKVVRAAIFQPPKNPAPMVKVESLRVKRAIPEEAREHLAIIRKRPEFAHTSLMPEGVAYVEVTSILLEREAKVLP